MAFSLVSLPSAMRNIACCHRPALRQVIQLPPLLSTRISRGLSSWLPSSNPRTLAHWPQLAITKSEDIELVRKNYRPFLLPPELEKGDWISQLELESVASLSEADRLKTGNRLRVLVLYGNLQPGSYSKLMALEASRILHRLGCDVRIFNPALLPVRTEVPAGPAIPATYPSAKLRSLSAWSDGHIWVSPAGHGEKQTPIIKNQVDWLRQKIEHMQPTQGRTLSVLNINNGPRNLDSIDFLSKRGRSMGMFPTRMSCSIGKALNAFDFGDRIANAKEIVRLLPSSDRDSLVDCMEEFVKFTIVMRPHIDMFGDQFSDRKERHGIKDEEDVEKYKGNVEHLRNDSIHGTKDVVDII